MRHRLVGSCLLVVLTPAALPAQVGARPWSRPLSDSATVVLVEHQFSANTADSVLVSLRKSGFYWAELEGGAGTPVVRPTSRGRWEALVVPRGPAGGGGPEVFEVHPGATEVHSVQVADLSPGTTVTLRLYGNPSEELRLKVARERSWGIGLGLAAGLHTGYRLDPTGGIQPGGGGDTEGCIIIESAIGLGGCLGIARQSLPDADASVIWYFIEPRMRLLSRPLFGSAQTDFGLSLRLAQGGETGPRNISPSQLSAGVYVTQHLSGSGRRRGWSIHLAYQHGKLGNVPETEHRDTDRVIGGLTWVP
jgi:hypothetical protein